MTINERLRLFGELRFSTAKDFADALGIYPQSLNNYYSGKRTPSVEIVQRAMELGCDPLWLLSGRGEMILTSAVTNTGTDQNHIDPRIREFIERDILQEYGLADNPRTTYEAFRFDESIPSWDALTEAQRRFYYNASALIGHITVEITRSFDRAVADLLEHREESIREAIHRFHELLARTTLEMGDTIPDGL